MPPFSETFTVDEIARAAGVPRAAVQGLIGSGELRSVSGSGLFKAADAVRAGRQARRCAVELARNPPRHPAGRRGLSALASSAVHTICLCAAVWSLSGTAETASTSVPPPARLVFLTGPGPGGGGGGGGRAPRAEVRRIARPRPTPTESATPDPQPLPSRTLVAAVAIIAGERHPESPDEDGAGPGLGPGLGEGTGGGAGGGPFRAGSGVDPPRLLHEIKAQYTDEARRRGVTGDVILEIVVRHDGSVGDIRVLRGLGSGLDERAVSAVGNWQFAPARRFGEPVDVIVEVAVEFALR
jgi:TonB family protein